MASPRIKLKPGTRIRDTYTVVRYVGSGRFADVYLVRHKYLGMQAMKLLVDAFDEEAGHEAFREAFVLSRITHPGIVRVFDANRTGLTDSDYPFITMEYVESGTLADMIDANTFGLRPVVALDLGLQMARALALAHAQPDPIVHRDIKPSNILVESSDRGLVARVADFGLAKAVDRFTDCVAAAGTLLYTAPESLKGFETPASDVFSLGLVLHELLTGVLPFRKSSLRECANDAEVRRTLAELHARPITPPSLNDPSLGPDIDFLMASMLANTLDERLQNAGVAATVIEACLASRQYSGEGWEEGEGRKPAELGFRIAREPSRAGEALEWFEKAIALQPALQYRLEPFRELIESRRQTSTRNRGGV
jgi:serine/threonine protein kinase